MSLLPRWWLGSRRSGVPTLASCWPRCTTSWWLTLALPGTRSIGLRGEAPPSLSPFRRESAFLAKAYMRASLMSAGTAAVSASAWSGPWAGGDSGVPGPTSGDAGCCALIFFRLLLPRDLCLLRRRSSRGCRRSNASPAVKIRGDVRRLLGEEDDEVTPARGLRLRGLRRRRSGPLTATPLPPALRRWVFWRWR